MSINEAPSPNLIGQQVDRSTSGQADNSVLAIQINDIKYSRICTGNLKAYHMLMLPDKAFSEDFFFSLGSGGLVPQASYAIMLQIIY